MNKRQLNREARHILSVAEKLPKETRAIFFEYTAKNNPDLLKEINSLMKYSFFDPYVKILLLSVALSLKFWPLLFLLAYLVLEWLLG